MKTILLILLFTLLSGAGDAQGFLYAGKVSNGGQFRWLMALESAAGFQFGVIMYWLALRLAALAVLSGIGWLMFRTVA